ncbi:MAG TPA: EF-hand domain-containing protein, partial [Isosphaeraceae bacterium]|nr:EF-hand domain-containing protein [Isosphaeraceae bacterium]
MNTRTGAWAIAVLASLTTPAGATDRPAPASTEAERDAVQDVIFLGDARPIFIRLRMIAGGKGFRSSWVDAVKAIHAYLDRDGDGTLTRAEADRGGLPTMVRAATGGAAALPRADLDTSPRDGKVSFEELADVLRPALGPFRVQVGQASAERTDALFGHIDRDKDGALTKDELAAAVSSLRRFDLDDDEMIGPAELDPFSNPLATQYNDDQSRRARFTAIAPVIELSPDDPSFRPVRLLLKRYDKGNTQGALADDNRLARSEFGIDPGDFKAADTDGDGALDAEELRRYLGRVGPDLEMTVTLPEGGASPATIAVNGAGARPLPPGVSARRISPGDVEINVGEVSLEFHADGGERSVENAKRYYASQFRAADTDNNKYLEKSELKDHGPFVATFDLMDRDGDGKLYM